MRGGAATRTRDDAGSALLMIPAGFLVVLAMAVTCVDFAIAHLGAREATDIAAQAGNDAVSASLDVDHFFTTGEIRLDETRIVPAVEASVASRDTSHMQGVRVSHVGLVDGDQAIEVEVGVTVRTVFAPIVGLASTRTVSGSSTVRIADSAAPSP